MKRPIDLDDLDEQALPPPQKLKGGQRRSLDDALNPARFYQADGIVQPSTAHTPLSVLILTGALLVVIGFVGMAWARAGDSQVSAFTLVLSIFDRDSKAFLQPDQFRLVPVALLLPLAMFVVFRSAITLLYHENPTRGMWFWMLLAGLVSVYSLIHSYLILDYVTAHFLQTQAAEPVVSAMAEGFWLAVAGNTAIIIFAAGGWVFLYQKDR
jgi:hypothetical protein